MNREIKYRAWLKKEKKMVDVSSIDFRIEEITYEEQCNLASMQQSWYEFRYFNDIELMLGLKIYDETIVFIGDIVRVYGGEQMFGYYEIDKIITIKNLEDLVMLLNIEYGIDVIGNIYENKELLENEKED